ncbi:glycosyltransferase [Flavobacterium sp. 245]|uniref:glycosyltransferase n=1 Tax=Flavobacterium sp. 245 TaxID=2512115 RepID=UPI001061FA91|nr:glycosyltransferase [Flavobacterium sp. 245]TDP00875.1 hypothetical protein EV145_105257 [Flavobacterium sp. 245]
MNYNNLVSIIIPCYNDWQYIEQAVASALNQTYPYKEVIVIDDGSNAETKEVLKKLESKITKLITQDNQGQSTARNVGIKSAKGDYILVLDSDDFFEPSFCKKAIPIFLKKNEVKIVTCQSYLLYSNRKNDLFIPRGGSISNFMYANGALGTSMFKKEDWQLCGGYDEEMRTGFEDWEFFIRILKNGGMVEVIQEPLYNYRKRPNSTTSTANSNKYELLRYIYNKHKILYVDDFENFIINVLNKVSFEESQKNKILNSNEYKVGYFLLFPVRKIAHILKSLKK